MNVMVQNGEVITIVTVGEGFSQEVNIANEDGMANITVDTVPIDFADCDECDCLANCEGCCDLCGVEDEDNADNTCKKEVKPKELLKNGMFVLRNGIWCIVADTLFVCEDGDYSVLEDYDDDLYYKWDSDYHFDAIVEAKSFALAKNKYKNGEVVWKRK